KDRMAYKKWKEEEKATTTILRETAASFFLGHPRSAEEITNKTTVAMPSSRPMGCMVTISGIPKIKLFSAAPFVAKIRAESKIAMPRARFDGIIQCTP